MSNIYIQEPPTEGKVLLATTAGDIDIELWSKEAPKACRNFVQLCLEGYYDGSIFHRVIPKFIAQGGDPTGTGTGGESIYGSPFKDEFHSRLRFVRRGLVAMANAGPNDNGSQFFFTLGPCPDLLNKHTIFGKVTGETIYNLPRFEEGEFDKDDKPEFPHKIISTTVLNNPFDDIVPRTMMKIENEIIKEKRKGTKNFKLLSFGDEAEEDEEELVTATKKIPNKSNSAHDIAMDPSLSASIDASADRERELQRIREKLKADDKSKESIKTEDEEMNLNNADEQNSKRRSELRAEIRKLKRELQGNAKSTESTQLSDEKNPKKAKYENPVLEEYYRGRVKYEEERKKLPVKGVTRESQTLELLKRFSNKVKEASDNKIISSETDNKEEDSDLDEDEDESWLTHTLNFDENIPVLAKDASTRDDNWYDITDPRNALNRRRREKTK